MKELKKFNKFNLLLKKHYKRYIIPKKGGKEMKKKIILSIILAVAILCLWSTISNGQTYETDTFSTDLPNEFVVVEKKQYSMTAVNNSNTLAVVMESTMKGEYENNKVVITNEYLNAMVKYFEQLYGADFALISSNLITDKTFQGVEIKFKNKENGVDFYVEILYYITDNYFYSVTFGSYDKWELESNSKKKIQNSFKVKDTVKFYNGIPFTDVKKSSWYYNSVKHVYDNGIIYGSNDYTFNPNANLTRGNLVTILWRMEGSKIVSGNQKFEDVKPGSYYYEAVKWAEKNNIVNGYSETKFGPNNNITREQLATIFMNYARFKKKDTSANANLNKYKDNNKISSYARESVSWAVAKKIISGKENYTKIDPHGKATRAEAAAMIENYSNYVGR